MTSGNKNVAMETCRPETEPIPVLATGTQDKMAQLGGYDRVKVREQNKVVKGRERRGS